MSEKKEKISETADGIEKNVKNSTLSSSDKRINRYLSKNNLSEDKFDPIKNLIKRNEENESIAFVSGEQGSGKTTVSKASFLLRNSKATLFVKFLIKFLGIIFVFLYLLFPFLFSAYYLRWELEFTLMVFSIWIISLLLFFMMKDKIYSFISKLNDVYISIDLWSIFKDYDPDIRDVTNKDDVNLKAKKLLNTKFYIFSRLWRVILLKIGFIPKSIEHFRLAMEYENLDTNIKHFSKSFIFFLILPFFIIGGFIGLSFLDGWKTEFSWIGGISSVIIYVASLLVIDIKINKNLRKIYDEGIGSSLIPEILFKKSKYKKIYIHFMDLDRVHKDLVGPIIHEITTLYKSKNINLIVECNDSAKKELEKYIKNILGIEEKNDQENHNNDKKIKEYKLKLIGTDIQVESLSELGLGTILKSEKFTILDRGKLLHYLFLVTSENLLNSYRYENKIKENFEEYNDENNNIGLYDWFDEDMFYEGLARKIIFDASNSVKDFKGDISLFKNSSNKWDMTINYSEKYILDAHERVKFLNFQKSNFVGSIEMNNKYFLDLMNQDGEVIEEVWSNFSNKEKIIEIPFDKLKLVKSIKEFLFKESNFLDFFSKEDDGTLMVKYPEKIMYLFKFKPDDFSNLLLTLNEQSKILFLSFLARRCENYSLINKEIFHLMMEFVSAKTISAEKMSKRWQKDCYLEANMHKVDSEGTLNNLYEIDKEHFLDNVLYQSDDVNEKLFDFILSKIEEIDLTKIKKFKKTFDNEQYIELFEHLKIYNGLEIDEDLTLELNVKIIIDNNLFRKLNELTEWKDPEDASILDNLLTKVITKTISEKMWEDCIWLINNNNDKIEDDLVEKINSSVPLEFIEKISEENIKWDKGYKSFGKFIEEDSEFQLNEVLKYAKQYNANRNIANVKKTSELVKEALKYSIPIENMSFDIKKDVDRFIDKAKNTVGNDWNKTIWNEAKLEMLKMMIKQSESNNPPEYIKKWMELVNEQGTYILDCSKIRDKRARNWIMKKVTFLSE